MVSHLGVFHKKNWNPIFGPLISLCFSFCRNGFRDNILNKVWHCPLQSKTHLTCQLICDCQCWDFSFLWSGCGFSRLSFGSFLLPGIISKVLNKMKYILLDKLQVKWEKHTAAHPHIRLALWSPSTQEKSWDLSAQVISSSWISKWPRIILETKTSEAPSEVPGVPFSLLFEVSGGTV